MYKKIALLLLLILVFLIPRKWTFSQELDDTLPLLGFQDIYLRDSISTVISKVNSYGINYSKNNLKAENLLINPYLLIAKRFPFKYTPSSIILNINGGTYYMTFNNLEIRHFDFVLLSKVNNFNLQYVKIKKLKILKRRQLVLLNPNLTNLSLQFYGDKLYQVEYQRNLRLDQVKGLVDDFYTRFGAFTLLKVKDTAKNDSEKYILRWILKKDVQINVMLEKSSFRNLNKIDYARNFPRKFNNQAVKVSLVHLKLFKDAKIYKKKIYNILVDMLKQEIDRRYRVLEKVIKEGKIEQDIRLKKKNHLKYKYANKL